MRRRDTGSEMKRRWSRLTAAVAVLIGVGGLAIGGATSPAAGAPDDTVIYGVNAYGFADVVELNLTQGTFSQVGDIGRETQAADQDPVTGRVYFYEWKTRANEFGYWDPATGTNTIVRVYNPRLGFYAKRMAFGADGVLYMMDSQDRLYTIDHLNGDVTLIGQVTGLPAGQFGGTGDMAFAPDGTLYVASYRSLHTVDIATLTSTELYSDMIPLTGVGIVAWSGLAYCDGILYASHLQESTATSGIFSIDPATGAENLEFQTTFALNDLTSCPAFTNDPPVADDDSITLDEDTTAPVTLSATDPDGDPLTYTITSGPTNGTLSGTAPNLTYTPNPNYAGPDTITYTANDGTNTSNTATITITITPINDPPVADDDTATTQQDTPTPITLSATDPDGDPLTYTITSGPTNGTLSGTAPNLTYTPNPNYAGPDTITYTANDGTNTSNTATITITITEVNDPPVADDDSITLDEDTTAPVTLSATDPDGDPLTYTITSGPTNGTLSGTAPNLTYTPNPNYAGPDTITYTANDGTNTSNTATITITITEVNDPPVADDDSITLDEDTTAPVTLSATDPDGDPLTYTITSGPTNGTLSGTAPNLTYTPNPNYAGPDTITYTANDGTNTSNTATITITITEVPVDLLTYASSRSGLMREINLTQGTAQTLPSLPFGSHAIARHPSSGLIYALEWTTGSELITYDPVTGSSTVIQTYSPALGLFGTQMAFAPDGTLYLIDATAQLWTIDTGTGDLTAVGTIAGLVTGAYGQVGDLAFAPDGTAYLATYGDLYTVDVNNLTATLVAGDQFGTPSRLWLGLAYCDGELYGADGNGATARSSIFRIDLPSGALTLIDELNGYITDLTGCAAN